MLHNSVTKRNLEQNILSSLARPYFHFVRDDFSKFIEKGSMHLVIRHFELVSILSHLVK